MKCYPVCRRMYHFARIAEQRATKARRGNTRGRKDQAEEQEKTLARKEFQRKPHSPSP